jgi:hypothetical protein
LFGLERIFPPSRDVEGRFMAWMVCVLFAGNGSLQSLFHVWI